MSDSKHPGHTAPEHAPGLSVVVRDLFAVEAAHDRDTALHSRRVVELARRVGRALGVDALTLRDIGLVALLHDVGKVRIPAAVLNKPGALTESEWLLVLEHPAYGADLVAARTEVAPLAAAIRASHERWDGKGYPDGLSGEGIPLASRVAFVADAFDAMTSDRPYRRAMSTDAALEEVEREAGQQFCPVSARALVEVVSPPWRMLGRPRASRSAPPGQAMAWRTARR